MTEKPPRERRSARTPFKSVSLTDPTSSGKPRVSAHALDIVLKLEAEGLAAALPAYLNLPLAPIVRALPTELPQLSLHTERLDSLFELADGMLLHLEYQSEHRPDTLTRFLHYDIAVTDVYRRPIRTIVFYGPNVTTSDEHLDYESIKYYVTAVYMGGRDGEELLRALQEKAARGDSWNEHDRLDLAFLPLMRQQRPLEEVVRATLRLVPALPPEARTKTTGLLMGLAYHYLGEGIFDGLMEELKQMSTWVEMLDRSLEEGLEKGREQGRAQGHGEARREDIVKVLDMRFGALSPALAARLNKAAPSQLDALFDAALTVPDLEALEALLPSPTGNSTR